MTCMQYDTPKLGTKPSFVLSADEIGSVHTTCIDQLWPNLCPIA